MTDATQESGDLQWSPGEEDQSPAPSPAQLARFIGENERLIRHRYRSQLHPRLRRMLETGDILSTVFRRTHRYLGREALRRESTGGLWRLVELITRRAAMEHARRDGAKRRAEARWREARNERSGTVTHTSRDLLSGLADTTDREIVRLRMAGRSYREIALALEISEVSARQRWTRVRQRLMEQIRSGDVE